MSNDIKVGKSVIDPVVLNTAKKNTPSSTLQSEPVVAVTHQIDRLVSMLGSVSGDTASESSRLEHVKKQILSGSYQMDVEKLSDSLLKSGVLSSGSKL